MEKCSPPSSSSAGAASMNGLKFGKKIYFEEMGTSGLSPPPSSPAKKGRTGVAEPPKCQVEGCKVDLSGAKAYYSKHKVCGMHSKSPKVTVAGIEQRFCQQCSRFHQLPEFDQGKRSCRRRLAGHNERRRKPSTGSLLLPHRHGSISPSMFDGQSQIGGGFVMDLSRPYPYSAFTGRNSWPNAAALDNQAAIAGKPQLTWLSTSPQTPLTHFLQGSSTRLGGCFNGDSDSTSALSLLSSHPWSSKPRSSSSGFEVNNFLATGAATSSVQPSISTGVAVGGQFTHELLPDLGLGQASHRASGHYAGELGLAQPGDGQFHQVDQSRGNGSCFWPL